MVRFDQMDGGAYTQILSAKPEIIYPPAGNDFWVIPNAGIIADKKLDIYFYPFFCRVEELMFPKMEISLSAKISHFRSHLPIKNFFMEGLWR